MQDFINAEWRFAESSSAMMMMFMIQNHAVREWKMVNIEKITAPFSFPTKLQIAFRWTKCRISVSQFETAAKADFEEWFGTPEADAGGLGPQLATASASQPRTLNERRQRWELDEMGSGDEECYEEHFFLRAFYARLQA